MSRFSYILLLTACSAGPGMLWAQTQPVAGQAPELREERRFRPPAPGEEGSRPPGDWSRGRSGRDGKDGRSFRNPMDDFRRLLAKSPEEREIDLAERPEFFRTSLLKKLKEYDALSPQEQELRLRSTELRFDLMSLLGASAERRADKLERIPEGRRELVKARLEQWDKLPEELKREVQEHQSTLHYVIRLDAAPEASKEDVFAGLSPEHRERIKSRVVELNSLPKEQRSRMIDAFHGLFDLTENEQESILQKLSHDQREKLEKRIADYEKLSPEVRKQCMDSAREFNKLSPEERERFMATAERWKSMSEDERNTWRNLVRQMPPLPPGLNPIPPLPPGVKPQGHTTNAPALPSLPPAQ